jgi:hypothetical protein
VTYPRKTGNIVKQEVALYARDQGITLALQMHPEITGNNKETLELIEEIGVDSLKVGLDLPLLESQDPEFIRETVSSMKGLMVYSHTISIAEKFLGIVFWESEAICCAMEEQYMSALQPNPSVKMPQDIKNPGFCRGPQIWPR